MENTPMPATEPSACVWAALAVKACDLVVGLELVTGPIVDVKHFNGRVFTCERSLRGYRLMSLKPKETVSVYVPLSKV
jgi:hypothetical protein